MNMEYGFETGDDQRGDYMNQIKCPKCGEVFTIDESDYESIVRQIKDHEYREDLKRMEDRHKKDLDRAVQLAVAEAQNAFSEALGKKDAEIAKLGSEIKKQETEVRLAVSEAVKEKDEKIAKLSAEIQKQGAEAKLAINEAVREKET